MAGRTVLEVRGLSVAFGQQPPVTHGVDLTLKAGQITALVGESGSGKSVTSSAIMGLLPEGGHVVAGSVREGDVDWLQSGPPLGRGLSMVFQDPMSSLNPSMRVADQVAEPLIVHGGLDRRSAWKEAVALLDAVELPDPERSARKYPHELSGGQKQRVMLALALACQPRVLIADEPTTALDVTVQRSILDLLRRLQAEHDLAVLFITHDLAVVADIAHDVVVLRNGEVVETGAVRDVFGRPAHAYTRSLLAAHRRQVRHEHAATGPVLIELEGVVKEFVTERDLLGRPKATFQALRGIDLEVMRGERLGVVGESGSGKSTLGRAMLGLMPIEAGRIAFDGAPVDAEDREAMARLRKRGQFVFQDPYAALNPRMTIGAALREVLQVHGRPTEDAERLLAEVGLEADVAGRLPSGLSGGQRARVVIARALAVDPEFLVLDESVAALDTAIREAVLQLLDRLARERRLTYVFISHDLEVVAAFCDRIAVMHEGRIVELGNAKRVMAEPEDVYTQRLLASQPGQKLHQHFE